MMEYVIILKFVRTNTGESVPREVLSKKEIKLYDTICATSQHLRGERGASRGYSETTKKL